MVLIEGTVNEEASSDSGRHDQGARRGMNMPSRKARSSLGTRFRVRVSPITQRIILFNLFVVSALIGIVFVLFDNTDQNYDAATTSIVEKSLLGAQLIEIVFPEAAPVMLAAKEGFDGEQAAKTLATNLNSSVAIFSANGRPLFEANSAQTEPPQSAPATPLLTGLNLIWSALSSLFVESINASQTTSAKIAQSIEAVKEGAPYSVFRNFEVTSTTSHAFVPIKHLGSLVGILQVSQSNEAIDRYVSQRRELVIRVLLFGWAFTIIFSLILASTISSPLSDLALAAEGGGDDTDGRQAISGRVEIPDLTGRPDEIGRLSGALRNMVTALYERIDANEQFAADVAHEIKNPLASLRSAVGTMRVAQREDQRDKLLDVIEHDVRRLDRLVSDISNASRLDSELVKEDQSLFDVLKMLRSLTHHMSLDAEEKGIDFVTDFPPNTIKITGLEHRLAQVFVNLISNAISFCAEGDAIRVWARARENRVLIVVEDTGPGIPEAAVTKIFDRFYSQRPADDFGNNSGLGLSISKQIIEAHDGVIWAENIVPTASDPMSEPLGARFVVGLPA